MNFKRITINPKQMGGIPCIRSLRIPVSTIVSLIADGLTFEEVLKFYPDLENEDIKESLYFASISLKEKEIPLLKAS